ncbi:hypothetical protein FB45DRAFT_139031 [Roridomyces roridus]|uniref:MYND-type domain-containing protein n=1 Tax=Roridomyces roridus TaxID=1738132 RepID=A0AAD7FHY1_9AGAR|nr:hypothetical protein FB45DRAFT_139031 [Roridomyces roridus]
MRLPPPRGRRSLFNDPRLNVPVRNTISVALIRCIAVCAQQRDLAALNSHLKGTLSELLASCTIHWGDGSGLHVVRALADREQMVQNFNPEMRGAWTRFAALAKERADFANSFDSDGILNMKACDNTLCTKLGSRKEFKRCSGCVTLFYCSIQCQAVDWHSGHRAACKTHDYQLSGRVPINTPRQRAFMRAILHSNYTKLKLEIFSEAVECMRQSRNPLAGFFVVFDYSQGGPEFGVYSLAETSDSLKWLSSAGLQWDETVARAARSQGRMVIHVIRVREANTSRHWVVPLRSDSGKIHAQLVKMACAEEGGNEMQGFEALVARSNEVTEVH